MLFQQTDTLVNVCKCETAFISMVKKELKLKAKTTTTTTFQL